MATRPEPHRRIPAGCARRDPSGAGARCLTNHAQVDNPPSQQLLDDLHSFQRVLFTNSRVRALSDAIDEGTMPLPDPDPPLERAGAGRARSCSSVPAPSATAAPGSRPPQRPGDSISRHLQPVPASRRYRDARALRVRAVPAATRAQRPDVRDHVGERRQDPSHELRSRPGAADGVRWRPCSPGRLEQVRHARTSRDPPDRPVLPQQQRGHASKTWSITTWSSSSACRPMRRRVSCRRSRRRTACTSIGTRLPKSARRSWRTCESCRQPLV